MGIETELPHVSLLYSFAVCVLGVNESVCLCLLQSERACRFSSVSCMLVLVFGRKGVRHSLLLSVCGIPHLEHVIDNA